MGLGADRAHLYPFANVATLVLANNLLFLLLLAPAVTDAYARHWFPVFGSWASLLAHDPGPDRAVLGTVLIWLGALGAYALGLAGGGWSRGPAVLGTWSGWTVWLPVALGLVTHAAGLVWVISGRRPPRPEAPQQFRFLRPM